MQLEKVHITKVKQGMVIMACDNPEIKYSGFGKPISNLSVLVNLERAGVQYVFVKPELKEEVHLIHNEPKREIKQEAPIHKDNILHDKETINFKELTVANDMLDDMVEHTTSAFGDFFNRRGASVQEVNVEMMANVVNEMIDINASSPDIFSKIISSEGISSGDSVHAVHVCIHSVMLAQALGIKGQELVDISLAGLIHDVGFSRLDKHITKSKEMLSEYELNLYKKHPLIGEELCSTHPNVNDHVAQIVAMHHECVDGSGYPGRVAAPYIPRGALIVGIAEAYNSMLLQTPDYVMRFSRKEAMRILYSFAGNKYPRDMVRLFISIMGVYPVGSALELSNGKLGIVVEVNHRNQACPKILMLEDGTPSNYNFVDLALHRNISITKELDDFGLKISPMKIFADYIYSRAKAT